MLALIPLNVALVFENDSWIYTVIWIMQLMFYLAAQWLASKGRKNKLLYIPYYFLFMNANVFRGIRYLATKTNGTWEKAKRG